MMQWRWTTRWDCRFGHYRARIATDNNKDFGYRVERIFDEDAEPALLGTTDSLRKAQRIIYEWAVANNQPMTSSDWRKIL
jgi:hypothetical protein